MLKIPDFTKKELNDIIEKANFTERELQLFELRNKEYSHERCAEMLNISFSTEKRTNKKMLAKIMKII